MVNGDHFQSLSYASVFKEDVRGQLSVVVVHDSSVSSAATDVEFCQRNEVVNLYKDVLCFQVAILKSHGSCFCASRPS